MNEYEGLIIPYKERSDKLKPREEFRCFDGWFGYLINEYIPSQPDAPILMKLYIDLKFDWEQFLEVLKSED